VELELVPAKEALRNQREQLGKMKGKIEAALKFVKSGVSVDEVAKIIEIDKNKLIAAAQAAGIKFEIK
jgi:carbamate kinase